MGTTTCRGYKWSGVCAGIKKDHKKDLGLICSDVPAAAAAVFTRNRVKAAPVMLDAERIRSGVCQAVIVNSGNANCCTGEQGMHDAVAMAAKAAQALGINEDLVLVASTGVIGAPLPMGAIASGMADSVDKLDEGGVFDFAESIITSDKFPKIITTAVEMENGETFSICAVAKGAGMIRPDMATMLCFVCTDAVAAVDFLSESLAAAVNQSFNRITVDGDTSTNDTVVIMANGMSKTDTNTPAARDTFQKALNEILLRLAKMIVKDGEGATKCVEVVVEDAASDQEARVAADTVAESSLVKTAIFGEDANWGRIMAALGRSGVTIEPERIDIYFDNIRLVENGLWTGEDAETAASAILKNKELTLRIDLKTGGKGTAAVLTCDLSLEYVKINSDYRS
ncbi:MAG: bifunctional glutamate N-acetyltransferase/amino-acid acetyltransferase ArgJ [Thermodesulfobacteriota bacterium]|nr:bifunctional glutamate N-acetyltransferase/amino-acid acetyltransferase ArgJ [Thermodesulfobacteriota bacterium]